MSAFLIYQTLW